MVKKSQQLSWLYLLIMKPDKRLNYSTSTALRSENAFSKRVTIDA